jgi:hypothetical protein
MKPDGAAAETENPKIMPGNRTKNGLTRTTEQYSSTTDEHRSTQIKKSDSKGGKVQRHLCACGETILSSHEGTKNTKKHEAGRSRRGNRKLENHAGKTNQTA